MSTVLIPICAWCSHVMHDGQPVGEPVDARQGPYTHGLCQECAPSVWEQARRAMKPIEEGE